MTTATVPNLPIDQHAAPMLGIGQEAAGENIEPRRAGIEAQRQGVALLLGRGALFHCGERALHKALAHAGGREAAPAGNDGQQRKKKDEQKLRGIHQPIASTSAGSSP
jgi:hypothetical protein